MTNQAVAKRGETAVATPIEGAGLSGNFGESDVVVPVCSLTQPMSQDRGKEGKFWFPDGRSFETMNVAVLDIVATRTLWGEVDSGINAPLCRSADRRIGLTNFQAFIELVDGTPPVPSDATDEPAEIICETCRFGPSADTFEKEGGLWCPNGYTLLMANAETDEVFLYFVKGTQTKPVKKVIVSPALLRLRSTGSAAPWKTQYLWKPQLVEEKEKKRKYWFANIRAVGEFGEAEQKSYAAMSAKHRGRASTQTLEEEAPENGQAKMDVADDPGPPGP